MTPRTAGGLVKFRPLRAGSRVALVAPASPFDRTEFEAGAVELRRLGLDPVFDDSVFERRGFLAGAADVRAGALMRAWTQPDIDAIIAVRGGYGSVETLPLLDRDRILASRTAFVGYSDFTSIHVHLACGIGLASLHGPMVEGRLARGVSAYDAATFLRGLGTEPLGELTAPGLEVIKPGEATGPLYGGTLTQLLASLSTPFEFSPSSGHVLFLDEVGERPYRLHRMLTQLRLSGRLASASALVFGQWPRCDEPGGAVTARSVIADSRLGLSRAGAVRLSLGPYDRTAHQPAARRPRACRRAWCAGARHRGSGGGMTGELVHFIGIGGTAMATLAAMLKTRGYRVQGSDHGVYPPMSEFLAHETIRVFDAYHPDHITDDISLVVVGNAISRGNVELETVLDRKIRYRSMPEMIRESFLWGARSIVIAGTHGKTTTTSMVGWLLTAGGLDPSVLIGGIAANFDASYRLGAGRDFVIEGDEYDSAFFDKTAKFLKYLPDIAVVGNLEYDHADIYPDMDALRLAFRRFLAIVPRNGLTILGVDSPEAAGLAEAARSKVETFGLGPGADWRASSIARSGSVCRFDVSFRDERFGQFEVPLYGTHNVRNALAALAVGRAVGLDPDSLRHALLEFQGVRRRLELRGVANGVSVYDDFAHHPTAILETLQAMRTAHPAARVWAVFEPRSATSCRRVFQDAFAKAFIDSGADETILAPVFRSSLPDDERLSVEQLVDDVSRSGRRARCLPDVDRIVETIAREARPGDLVVIMSNGGFGGIHGKLLDALAKAGS